MKKSSNDAICGSGTTQWIFKDLHRVRVKKLEPIHSSLEVVLVQSDKNDDNDQLLGQFSVDTTKTCPEGLSDWRRKLAQCMKETKLINGFRSGLFPLGIKKLQRLLVTIACPMGDFDVDTMRLL